MKLFSKEDLDAVQVWTIQRRLERVGWVRMVLFPALAGLLALTLVGDESGWRWSIMILGASTAIVASFAALMKWSRPWWPAFLTNIGSVIVQVVVAFGLGAFILATGGFDSPLLPAIVMFSFLVGALASIRSMVSSALAYAAIVATMAVISRYQLIPDLLPAVFGGGAWIPQPSVLLWAKAGMLVFAIFWGAFAARNVRQVFRQMASDAIDARDEVLASNDAHARELTALSGELAHELKNPLANVKGLAVLIGRDIEGRAAERLSVLQNEVLRMEGVLESFLTFSRPLLPLSQQEIELKELCEAVVALHEGVAHARLVTVKLAEASSLRLWCDERKVKQILINLVQNALDASPCGSTVELSVLPDAGGGGRVKVQDRGPGLSPAVRGHLFEPGMTTKERGSGLGLAIARSLARQHGGELVLDDRPGGGCTASLILPPRIPASSGAAA